MVNRPERDRLALALRRLATGRITTDEFEDVAMEIGVRVPPPGHCECGYNLNGLQGSYCPECGNVPDRGLHAMAGFGWSLYDDLRGPIRFAGKHKMTRTERRFVAQAILFLKGDHEYECETPPEPVSSRAFTWIAPLGLFFLAVAMITRIRTFLWVAIAMIGFVFATSYCHLIASQIQRSWSRFRGHDKVVQTSDPWPFTDEFRLRLAARKPVFLNGTSRA